MDKLAVIDTEGQQAVLESPPTSVGGEPVTLQLASGTRVEVPASLLDRHDDGSYRVALSFTDIETGASVVLQEIEERIHVSKRPIERGRVRLTTRVDTREEEVDEALLEESIDIERVPIGRYVDEIEPVRHEGDTTIVPVYEEVLVVEKRLRLIEEIRLSKKREHVRRPHHVTLRRQTVEVERSSANAPPSSVSLPATETFTTET